MKIGEKVTIKTRILGIISTKEIKHGNILDINSTEYEDWFGDTYTVHKLTIQIDGGKIIKTIIGDNVYPFQKYVLMT